MVLLIQKEVAERIVAKNNKESILSVSVKAFGIPKLIAKVPPGAFSPPPKVDSAIISITDISDSQFTQNNLEIHRFFRIIKTAFAHKRKFAVRNLESITPKENLENIWKSMKINQKARAEDITVDHWLKIASTLQNLNS